MGINFYFSNEKATSRHTSPFKAKPSFQGYQPLFLASIIPNEFPRLFR